MARHGRILLVDNSRSFSALLSATLSERLGLTVSVAASLAEAVAALDAAAQDGGGVDLVISGLVLPDAADEAVVATLTRRGCSLVVLTGAVDAATRDRILTWPVIDYVPKGDPGCVDYVVWLVGRLTRNRALHALVVEDSRSFRSLLCALLRLYGFTVREASDGLAALELVRRMPRLDLVVVDYDMPGMDGVQLVRRLRADHPRDRLAILGISSSLSPLGPVSAQFLKAGASDFLDKPFLPEELFCRISQNLEIQESLAALRALARTDPLTGLANRRAFFETAPRLLGGARRSGRRVAAAMLDIDHFKRINDTFGHDQGDRVLSGLGRLLAAQMREGDLLARLGGEEFGLLCVLGDGEDATAPFERLCQIVRAADLLPGLTVSVSIGVGVCAAGGAETSLHDLLKAADAALYRAKADGRDRVALTDGVVARGF